MREATASFAELIRVFENSSQYSEYYLDLANGEILFFSPMDFPGHSEIIQKMDENNDKFVKLPKLTQGFSREVKQAFVDTVEDPYLKEILQKSLNTKGDILQILMEFEQPRRRWYKYENERYIGFLKEWFSGKGIIIKDRT
ncbi:MAG: UPF0158 family protein [Eubacteriales bacterium]